MRKRGGRGRDGLVSGPVFAPILLLLCSSSSRSYPPSTHQTGAPWHPGDTCPTKPSHPPPQKPILSSILSIFFPLSPSSDLCSSPHSLVVPTILWTLFILLPFFASFSTLNTLLPPSSVASPSSLPFPNWLAAQRQRRVESCE